MLSYLNENFDLKAKNSSEEALQRWRNLCCAVKNPKRRFRFTANLSQRFEAEAVRRSNQEKIRVAVLVSQAAFRFSQGISLPSDYTVPEEVKAAGFQICADELGSIVEGRDVKKLKDHGGVKAITGKVGTSIINGISTSEKLLNQRREIYGVNKFTEKPSRGFFVYVWKALQDTTLMILALCAFVYLLVGLMTEGWATGAYDGLGIVATILLVVFVTASRDYIQSPQFKDSEDWERVKKLITAPDLRVTRDGFRQKLSMYDLLPGDIVHLSIGDVVPADGLFIYGHSLLIDESNLTGESELVKVDSVNPFLLSGTKVADGYCSMLVTTVGMRTQWGMATLSEGGDDETPLQVKLNGVATIIGKIGLFFAVVTFAVLVQGLFSRKLEEGFHLIWSGDDLPLAVTLSLAFAMKKMMNDMALVRHLAACGGLATEDGILTDGGLATEGPEFREKSEEELPKINPKLQVAKESAIAWDDNFSRIVTLAKWGNIPKFVQLKLIVNVVALIVNFSCAHLIGWTPLTAVQLLLVNMIMNILGALALATDIQIHVFQVKLHRVAITIGKIGLFSAVVSLIFAILFWGLFSCVVQYLSRLIWNHYEVLCATYILNSLDVTLYSSYKALKQKFLELRDKKCKTEVAGTKKSVTDKFLYYKMVDSKPVVQQVEELHVIMNELPAEDMVINEAFQVGSVIEKLPPSWNDFKENLKQKKSDMRMKDLVSILRDEEDRRKNSKDDGAPQEAEGNIVEASSSKPGQNSGKRKKGKSLGKKSDHAPKDKDCKRFKGSCWGCGKPGHPKKDCSHKKRNNATELPS